MGLVGGDGEVSREAFSGSGGIELDGRLPSRKELGQLVRLRFAGVVEVKSFVFCMFVCLFVFLRVHFLSFGLVLLVFHVLRPSKAAGMASGRQERCGGVVKRGALSLPTPQGGKEGRELFHVRFLVPFSVGAVLTVHLINSALALYIPPLSPASPRPCSTPSPALSFLLAGLPDPVL